MTIDKTQLAVILVTVAALVFVAYSVVLLTKIRKCTEESATGLAALLSDVRLEIQGFRFASTQLNGLIERSSAALASLDLRLKTPAAGPTASPVALEFFREDSDRRQSVAAIAEDDLAQGLKEDHAGFARLLTQRRQLEKELDALRANLRASECTVAELRRKSYSEGEAGSAAARLQTLNQRLLTDVREARRRQLEAEQRLDPLVQELQQVKARPGQGAAESAELVADNVALRGRVAELEASVRQLQSRVQDGDEALSRILREKTMIEERFLEGDVR